MASSAVERWVKHTVLIHNQWGGSGTGFFVARSMSEENPAYGKLFIVTNKHVVHEDPTLRHSATTLILGVNVKKDNKLIGERLYCHLRTSDGVPLWREHPEDDVDVFAVDVSWLVFPRDDIDYLAPNYDLFADSAKIAQHQIIAGDEIFVTGYPAGIRQGKTNHPLVRRGIIASRIGEELEEDVSDPGNSTVGGNTRTIRGFLIDGATVPGSSGSPVFLDPGFGRIVRGSIEGSPPLLLGIIAETRFVPVNTPTGTIPSFAGLGLAFDADTIRETIELFSFD